ncbi:MAG: serine/threonine protein kinase [Bacillariaceae sp.]|jgi:serine/threonine protein kinase
MFFVRNRFEICHYDRIYLFGILLLLLLLLIRFLSSHNIGELYAVKKISKQYTTDATFEREMDAFMHMRQSGDHPNICGLHENFEEGNFYYLILDLVQGGEMFDHLIRDGAYSEADAARLVREVGSALNFLHGIGLVHSDLKPENLYVINIS